MSDDEAAAKMREFKEKVLRPGLAKAQADGVEKWINSLDADLITENDFELRLRLLILPKRKKRGRPPKHAPTVVFEIEDLRSKTTSVREATKLKTGVRDHYNREKRKLVRK